MLYGIKYLIKSIGEKIYILSPLKLVEGTTDNEKFYTNKEEQINLLSDTILEENTESYVVDKVVTASQLKEKYGEDDLDFLKDFYFESEKELLTLILILNNSLEKISINLLHLVNKNSQEIYTYIKSQPAVILNSDTLKEILEIGTIDLIKSKLKDLQTKVESFSTSQDEKGVTQIKVENGHVTNVSLNSQNTPNININKNQSETPKDDSISVKGLEQYLKERVFGHDEEIRNIATILIMNHTATLKDGTESILIPGPTGTGKTVTFEVASEYLNIPFININAANLVPSGIVGTSLEDELCRLYRKGNNDLELAQKGIVILDEFDKIDDSTLDIKTVLKEIFLKFIEGSDFTIDKKYLSEDLLFSTKMLSKVFLGTFSKIYENKRTIGFGTKTPDNCNMNLQTLYNGTYYNKELLSRISHVLPYQALTHDTMLKIILKSKLSVYLAKKQRLTREYKVEIKGEQEYAEAIIAKLEADDRSVRDINNIIRSSLLQAEYEILSNPNHYHTLVLKPNIIEDASKFDLT